MAGNRELTGMVYRTLALILAERHPGSTWSVRDKSEAESLGRNRFDPENVPDA